MWDTPTTFAAASDCLNSPPYGGVCARVRTVEYLPRECPAGSHTRPDEEGGATCVCRPDYIPDGNASSTSLSCHRECRHRVGETVSRDGGSCECSESYYDVRETGVLLCTTDDWRPEGGLKVYTDAAAQVRNGSKCLACPAECANCTDGGVTLGEGWRLDGKVWLRSERGLAPPRIPRRSSPIAARRPRTVTTPARNCNWMRCPKRLRRTRATAGACADHHTGQLCFSCEQGFSRRTSDGTCNPCDNDDKDILVSPPKHLLYWLLSVVRRW